LLSLARFRPLLLSRSRSLIFALSLSLSLSLSPSLALSLFLARALSLSRSVRTMTTDYGRIVGGDHPLESRFEVCQLTVHVRHRICEKKTGAKCQAEDYHTGHGCVGAICCEGRFVFAQDSPMEGRLEVCRLRVHVRHRVCEAQNRGYGLALSIIHICLLYKSML